MLRAGVGHSTANNPATASAEATEAALAEAGLRIADAALCFATSAYGGAYPLMLRTVAAEAGTLQVAGCSSLGVIGGGREIESGPGVSVLVIGGASLSVKRLFAPSLRGRDSEVVAELASAARPAMGRNNLLCLFADTYNLNPDAMLQALARELPGVAVVGGGATEDGTIGETFQFCGDVVSSNSASGMLLSGDLEFNIGASLACTPLGPAHRVTAARDGLIMELDGRPAFEIFAETAGPLAANLRRALSFVFLGIPTDPDVKRLDRGNYFVRGIIGASPEHGVLAVAHRPHNGDLVGFVLRDAERAREDLKATLGDLHSRIGHAPAFGLYFNCVSRGCGLYQIPDHDSAYIAKYLGRIPIAGFFTGFEIGPTAGRTRLLEYSGVLALVSESPA
jgi:small ligand-binding sensory domain FIST